MFMPPGFNVIKTNASNLLPLSRYSYYGSISRQYGGKLPWYFSPRKRYYTVAPYRGKLLTLKPLWLNFYEWV